MDYRDIREKLERYWQCESTLEEERQLRDFFSARRDPLPDDLQQAAGLFCFYGNEASRSAGDMPSPWAGKRIIKKHQTGRLVKLLRHYWEYAAILLLVLGSVWMFRPATHTGIRAATATDTFRDPAKALEATQKALQVLAANLNKGKDQMQKLALFNEAERAVQRSK